MDRNFRPLATVSLAATGSTGSVALSPSPVTNKTVAVHNAGTTLAFIKFGGLSVTAAVTDFPVPAGAQIRLDAGDNTYVAGIMSSGTATLYFTSGIGS
jgi:hypothetical protein